MFNSLFVHLSMPLSKWECVCADDDYEWRVFRLPKTFSFPGKIWNGKVFDIFCVSFRFQELQCFESSQFKEHFNKTKDKSFLVKNTQQKQMRTRKNLLNKEKFRFRRSQSTQLTIKAHKQRWHVVDWHHRSIVKLWRRLLFGFAGMRRRWAFWWWMWSDERADGWSSERQQNCQEIQVIKWRKSTSKTLWLRSVISD